MRLTGDNHNHFVCRFESVLAEEPDCASHHVNLAKCYWKQKVQYKECFTLLLKVTVTM